MVLRFPMWSPGIPKRRVPGEPVFVVQSPQSAESLFSIGLVAGTDDAPMKGLATQGIGASRAVVVPALCDAGQRFVRRAVRALYLDGAESVRVLCLWQHWPDLPWGADPTTLVERTLGGDGAGAQLRKRLIAFANARPIEPRPKVVRLRAKAAAR